VGVLARILLLFFLLAAPGLRPAFSHEGHSHGDEAAPPATAAPRAEAHSDLFEIVVVLGSDRRLWLYLDRHATTEPVDGATLHATLDGEDIGTAARVSEAVYVIAHPALERAGPRNLIFTITAGEEMDLLPVTLEIPAASGALTAARVSPELFTMALREPYNTNGLIL
jgi:cobalt-zinc-cadmium efflux system membrane fusion protein